MVGREQSQHPIRRIILITGITGQDGAYLAELLLRKRLRRPLLQASQGRLVAVRAILREELGRSGGVPGLGRRLAWNQAHQRSTHCRRRP